MRIERIVVGIDDSPGARTALEWAAGMARLCGAEVVAVHARGLLDRLHGTTDGTAEEPGPSMLEPLQRQGTNCRCVIRDGNPVDVLLAESEEASADLIVVGSRRFGGYPELLLGSTSTQVAQHARRPVVIIPV